MVDVINTIGKVSGSLSPVIDLYGGGVELFFYSGNSAYTVQDILGGYKKGNVFSGVNFLSSVKVSIDLLKFTQIEVVLNPTFDEAVKLIKSGRLGLGYSSPGKSGGKTATNVENPTTTASFISSFNMIGVRLHYGGQKTKLFKGILQQPEIEIGLDGISITLKGIGLLFAATKSAVNKPIKQKTKEQVLTALTEKSNVKIVIDPKDSVAKKALTKTININANATSDMDQVKRIANESGCRIIDAGVAAGADGTPEIQIASMDFLRKQGCQVTLAAFRDIDPNKNIYPILELSTSIANYQMGLSLGLQGAAFDAEKKAAVPKLKTDMTAKGMSENSQKVASSDGTTSNASSDPDLKGRVLAGPSSRSGVSSAIDSMRGWMQTLTETAFQYEVTTVGFLNAMPGKPVNVDVGGVSFLSGVYDCYTVTHEFNEGGIQTLFNLSRTFGLGDTLSNAIETMKDKTVRGSKGKTATSIPESGSV